MRRFKLSFMSVLMLSLVACGQNNPGPKGDPGPKAILDQQVRLALKARPGRLDPRDHLVRALCASFKARVAQPAAPLSVTMTRLRSQLGAARAGMQRPSQRSDPLRVVQ